MLNEYHRSLYTKEEMKDGFLKSKFTGNYQGYLLQRYYMYDYAPMT